MFEGLAVGQSFGPVFWFPDEPEVTMTRAAERRPRSAEAAARAAKIVELKRLITAGTYETIEKLEDAVDAFLWSEQDQLQERAGLGAIARSHPK